MDRARTGFALAARLLAAAAVALGLALLVGASAPKEALAETATLWLDTSQHYEFRQSDPSTDNYDFADSPFYINGREALCTDISTMVVSGSTYTSSTMDSATALRWGLYEKYLSSLGWNRMKVLGYLQFMVWTEANADYIASHGVYPNTEGFWDVYAAAQSYYEANKTRYAASGTNWYSASSQSACFVPDVWLNVGQIDLLKRSSNPDVSDGNACYDLKGAAYGVYRSSSDAADDANRVLTLSVNANGYAVSPEVECGNYWVREVTPGKGYGLDGKVYPVTVTAGDVAHVNGGAVYDAPQNDPAAMWVGKIDADTTANMPQGSASLAGAEYTVKYYAGYYSQADLPSAATRTWVVRTDEEGRAILRLDYLVCGDALYKDSQGGVAIPLGTITVQETKAPEGYLLGNQPIYVEQVTPTGVIETINSYNAPKDPEQVIRGGVEIKKNDSDAAHDGTAQGDASLAGITYAIVNESEGAVTVDGQSHAKGEVATTIVTDAAGRAATAADALPYGSYSVREVAKAGNLANDGYLVGSEVKRFDVVENGVVVSLSADAFENGVVRGNVTFKKLDRETGKPFAQGAGDLGATFEIVNESQRSVVVEGADYRPGEVVYTGKAEKTDAGWTFATPDKLLPYGTYSIREATPGTGYEKSDQMAEFQIREDGKTVDLAETASGTFANQVVRADVKFQKKDDTTGKAMAHVPFMITSKTTGEAHVAVTDSRGSIDTSATRKVANVFDAALKDDGAVDEDKLAELVARYGDADNADAWPGVWFGKAEDGSVAAASTALGALPFDEYEVKELACEANEGRQLIEDSFAIVRSDDHAVIDFGTMDDVEPSIRTNAWDGATGSPADKDVVADDEACVIDRVAYDDFVPGRTYHVAAELHDADSGEILKDASGNDVRAEADFTPDKKNGSVDMRLAFDASNLADGQKAVVYEYVTLDGRDVAKHADKNDAEQTVTFRKPAIATTAQASDNTKVLKLDPEAKLTDTVACKNLREGAEYVLGLELVRAAGGSPVLDAQGNPVTASKEFKAEAANMSVDVDATFDASQLEDGADLVCFETLTKKTAGKVAAEHKDLADAGQTLKTAAPRIGTTMTDAVGSGHTATVDDRMRFTDKVEHWGLIADGRAYELEAQLMVVSTDDETGEVTAEPYIDADGNEVKAVKEFTPDTAHGFVDVELSFNGLNLEDGQRLVCFETLKRAGSELAEHADAADAGQTVEVTKPKIGTTLADAADGDKTVVSNDPVKLVDTVGFTGLVPGCEYVVSGALMQKGGGEVVAVKDADGNAVTAKTTFAPEKTNGTVDVTFEFDGSELPHGAQLVAFESLSRSGVELAVHADIDDAAQTVEVANPLIGTMASDGLDGDGTVVADAQASILDDVAYKNLAKGGKYTLIGVVIDKSTGLPLYTGGEAGGTVTDTAEGQIESYYGDVLSALGTSKADVEAYAKALREWNAAKQQGEMPVLKASAVDFEALQKAMAGKTKLASQLVFAQKDFTAAEASGSAQMAFCFDASKWVKAEKPVDCVVFEFLVHDGRLAAAHADIEDAGQSVTIAPSTIATELTDKTDGDHTILPSTETVVVDKVKYDDLIPGKSYKVSGKLVLKDTGKQLYVGDKPVTAEREFTPNAASGYVELEFSFDSSSLDGKELVAFESLSKDGVEVAAHEDVDDAAQTVTVDSLNGAKGKAYSKTGVSLADYAWLGWMLMLAAVGTFGAGEVAHRRDVKRAAVGAGGAE